MRPQLNGRGERDGGRGLAERGRGERARGDEDDREVSDGMFDGSHDNYSFGDFLNCAIARGFESIHECHRIRAW
jgi:hypothetical protein